MKITLIQQDIEWASPLANQSKAEQLMRAAEKSDVYVLAEMFSTGFATQPEDIAERDLSSLTWMKAMAAELDAAVCGSVATEIDVDGEAKYVNRFYFVQPDGTVDFYDKHHLFTYGGEHHRYTRGEGRVEVDFRGVRFLLQICYDLRFPCFVRNNGERPYDVALYVASWPTSRIEAWKTLLHARAIENQCYVAAVDRIGSDPACEYCGGTMLIDPYGRTVSACPDRTEGCVTAELDMDALQAFRKKFPVLGDAD